MTDLKQETDRLLALAPRMPRYSLAVDGQLVWIADDMATHLRALQAENDRLQGDLKHLREVRDPGGCECSDDDACMFARQRDAFKAECEALRADAAIGVMVRAKLRSGNRIPVERCQVLASEVAAIDLERRP